LTYPIGSLPKVTENRSFQPLPERLAGLPVDQTLHDGVPNWLDRPLREWFQDMLRLGGDELSRRVVIRLRWEAAPQISYRARLLNCQSWDLLTVVDAALQLHPGWDGRTWDGPPEEQGLLEEKFYEMMGALWTLLVDAGSLYQVDRHGRCLVRRVDSTVQAAVDTAVTTASPTAAEHLRTAWVAAYGIHPDPDKAYNHAVLALEDVACPLVSPNNSRATLGTVIRDLGTQLTKWELAIGDKTGKPAEISRLIDTLKMLWEGQSRHAGSANSRQQSQIEAEAAVHMAATLVQWLSTGVLRRKPE
jgi:hypothetical protein